MGESGCAATRARNSVNRPGRAQHCLLVAHLDVAPDQKIQELAVAPQLAKIDEMPAPLRLDDEQREIVDRHGRGVPGGCAVERLAWTGRFLIPSQFGA
jgi:hypothetical protein